MLGSYKELPRATEIETCDMCLVTNVADQQHGDSFKDLLRSHTEYHRVIEIEICAWSQGTLFYLILL